MLLCCCWASVTLKQALQEGTPDLEGAVKNVLRTAAEPMLHAYKAAEGRCSGAGLQGEDIAHFIKGQIDILHSNIDQCIHLPVGHSPVKK